MSVVKSPPKIWMEMWTCQSWILRISGLIAGSYQWKMKNIELFMAVKSYIRHKFLLQSNFRGNFFFMGFHCRERGRKGFFCTDLFSRIKSKFFFTELIIVAFAYHPWKHDNFLHFSFDQMELHDIEILMCCLKTT